MQGRVLWVVLLGLVVIAPLGLAHDGPPPRDGHTRVMHDCADDYGWHNTGGTATDPGHGLVSLDLDESSRDGEKALMVYLVMDHRRPQQPRHEGGAETWETISFSTPHKDVTLTVHSTQDSGGSSTDDGGQYWEKTAGNVDPLGYEVVDPVHDGDAGQGEPNGDDNGRFGLGIYLDWADVQAESGEDLTDFVVEGEYDSGAGRSDGDRMAGDPSVCDEGQDDDDFRYLAPYRVQSSDWVAGDDPGGDDGGSGDDGDGTSDGSEGSPGSGGDGSNAAPDARFAADCRGLTCRFDASASDDPDGDSLSYEWSLGDKATSGEQTQHAYSTAGTYGVELTVSDGSADDTETSTVTVDPLPALDLETDCTGLTCTFNASGTTDDGNVTEIAWTTGEGTTATGPIAHHRYEEPGTFTLAVNATDDSGQWNTTQRTLSLTYAPNATFTIDPAPALVNDTVVFQGDASDRDATVEELAWDLGDGNTSTGTRTEHAFDRAGTYTVAFTATDTQGNANRTTQTLVIDAKPTGSLQTPETLVKGKEATFTLQADDADGSIDEIRWRFGEGSTATGKIVEHTYAQAETFTVRATVTDDEGYETVISQEVTVFADGNQAPFLNVTITPSEPEAGETVRFVDHSSDPDGEITQRTWVFGSGGNATGRTVERSFERPGEHTIRFEATDDNGSTARTDLFVEVHRPAEADTGQERSQSTEAKSSQAPPSDDAEGQPDDEPLTRETTDAGSGSSGEASRGASSQAEGASTKDSPGPGVAGLVLASLSAAMVAWRRG